MKAHSEQGWTKPLLVETNPKTHELATACPVHGHAAPQADTKGWAQGAGCYTSTQRRIWQGLHVQKLHKI